MDDPLSTFLAIERMEVGPPIVEPRRIRVPYRVFQNGSIDETVLAYTYEEDVFDPADPESLNLASLIGSQVALNYGLFCKEISFRGFFDKKDQQFLSDMMENTSREIYVNKLLAPNSFLVPHAKGTPVVKNKKYTRANVLFHKETCGVTPGEKGSPERWQSKSGRIAVLSSGGKDSLLSFGLLREMGYECHPLFVNESGRHWFTALNAYRYFSTHVAETGRVWTNADRIFSWMLRRLPFIRRDFASIRSDEYPIRLWTVAVFLFGAIPILRKRMIGRLVIGDEFDTTMRTIDHGITHYNGLFDQSRYFDNTLTRFFYGKGWRVSQFSILRTLSEILILKTLVERYPDLQRHQISCHAAHMEGDSIRPCGRCEKCLRIICMLSALGADAEACGYSEEQVQNCFRKVPEKGLHQEAVSIAHVAHLLREKGFLAGERIGDVSAKSHPEVMKLRFDHEKASMENIPVDLREPLLRILLDHADGIVKRKGRQWLDWNPFDNEDLTRPYPFESPLGIKKNKKEVQLQAMEKPFGHRLGDLTWPEAEKRFNEVDVALLPVGAIEQHGPHLPLDTDAFDAQYLANQVAAACEDPKPIVLPLIPYGVSYHHDDFAGTVGIRPETLYRIVYDVGLAVARYGITKLVIINGHGGNGPALHFAAQTINRDARIFTCVDSGETSDFDIDALAETPNDVHAGEIETSTTLAVRPEGVRGDKIKKFVPRFSSRYLNFSSKRSVDWYAYISKISKNGILGDPTVASREKGEQMWDVMIQHLVEFVEDLKNMSLDEIYQKRY
jgi:creatinine amidohydrolase/Fe(II)-dependent formamide hydrolase-like protein